MQAKRMWERVRDLARASPGELGLIAILVGMVLAGSAFVVANTWRRPPPPPIKRVVASAPAASAQGIFVHVSGMVTAPGVYELPDGSRVQDAILAAGGALEGADLDALNLAALISDGEKIVVPRPGEAVAAERGATNSGKININTANQTQLEELPGVGPVLAGRIIEYRQRRGPFKSVKQLMEVDGVGPKKFEAIKDLVTV